VKNNPLAISFLAIFAFFVQAGMTFAQTNNTVALTNASPNAMVTTVSLRQPAVSEINGKVDYSGGKMDSYVANNLSGSISLPVTQQFGFQGDALYSRISDLDFYGGAGHFFWRDPDIGLLGLTGGYLHRDGMDNINTFQAGAEGQFYYKQFTFGFFGGAGSIDYQYAAPFIDTDPTRFVGRVSADYYPLQNLRVGVSFTTAFHNNLGKAEIEYQTPINGLAITGEAAIGDHGYNDWLLGLRFYFGGHKTLRERQRQDDPPGLMPQILQSLGLYGSEFNRKENAWLNSLQSTGVGNIGGVGVGGGFGVTTITVNNPGNGGNGDGGGGGGVTGITVGTQARVPNISR
jgi:hypothetical protein